jgi:hypothetical protein
MRKCGDVNMRAIATLTIRLNLELKDWLERLPQVTGRSKPGANLMKLQALLNSNNYEARSFFSASALDDFNRQITYIDQDNPQAARQMVACIRRSAENLGELAIGRPGRAAGTYEKTLSSLLYILN